MLNGYKTYLGAILIGVGAALTAAGYAEMGELLTRFGEALSIGGLGHKLAKAVRARGL
jgi:hypothetical protein